MIYELEPPGSRILAIDCSFPEALAVIEGSNPGWIFADDPNNPRTALVWARGIEGFYLAGDTDSTAFLDHLDDYVDRVLKPRLRDLGVTWFEISGGKSWNPVIENTFAKRNLESSQQWVYTLKHKAGTQPETGGIADYKESIGICLPISRQVTRSSCTPS